MILHRETGRIVCEACRPALNAEAGTARRKELWTLVDSLPRTIKDRGVAKCSICRKLKRTDEGDRKPRPSRMINNPGFDTSTTGWTR